MIKDSRENMIPQFCYNASNSANLSQILHFDKSVARSAQSCKSISGFSSLQRHQHRWPAELSHNGPRQNSEKQTNNVFERKCDSISNKEAWFLWTTVRKIHGPLMFLKLSFFIYRFITSWEVFPVEVIEK